MPIKIGIASIIIIIGIIVSVYAIDGMSMNSEISAESKVNLEKIRQISHTLGSNNAPITIIEFGDYQCPFCGEWYENVSPALNQKYIQTNQVQLIFVDYPFLGPDSYPAAHASFCAEEQEKYWEFHEMVFVNQGNTNDGWASSDKIRGFASEIYLDMNQYDQCMESTEFKQKIDENLQVGREHGVSQTPTFIVLNQSGEYQKIEGKQPLVVFDEIIEKMN
jgi:protein-disulfide isomerase